MKMLLNRSLISLLVFQALTYVRERYELNMIFDNYRSPHGEAGESILQKPFVI